MFLWNEEREWREFNTVNNMSQQCVWKDGWGLELEKTGKLHSHPRRGFTNTEFIR